jgi:hypothetical protein
VNVKWVDKMEIELKGHNAKWSMFQMLAHSVSHISSAKINVYSAMITATKLAPDKMNQKVT